MAFNDHFNFDDILYRNVIVGLLDFLNRRVQYQQVEGPGFEDVKLLSVPYFFEMNGDERFLQDFYMNYGADCAGPGYAEGNYDPIPRGIISLSSMTINTANLTNKFVRGTFNKEESDGQIKAYSAFINVIPVSIQFGIEVHCSTYQQSLKIVQNTISQFYKAGHFAVDYLGMRVVCVIGFPEEYPVDKPIEFTYPDKKTIVIRYQLEMETYQPVIDRTSQLFRGNIMDHGIGNVLNTTTDGETFATLEVDVKAPESQELSNEERPPDTRAPYGYDVDDNPHFPENQPG